MSEPVLEASDLSVVHRTPAGDVHALSDASLELHPGELVVLVGPTSMHSSGSSSGRSGGAVPPPRSSPIWWHAKRVATAGRGRRHSPQRSRQGRRRPRPKSWSAAPSRSRPGIPVRRRGGDGRSPVWSSTPSGSRSWPESADRRADADSCTPSTAATWISIWIAASSSRSSVRSILEWAVSGTAAPSSSDNTLAMGPRTSFFDV